MAEQPPKEAAKTPAGPPAKKSKKLLIFGGIGVLLLAGGVTAAVMMMRGGKAKAEEEPKTTAEEVAADSKEGGHGGKSEAKGGEAKGGKSEGHGGKSEGHAGKEGESKEGSAKAEESDLSATSYPFEQPFVVNLIDANLSGRLFLQVIMQVETTTAEGVGRIKSNVAPLRDAVIMLLSSKTREEMATTEGKVKLKQELIQSMNSIVGPGTIKAVFFSEFNIHQQ